MQVIWKSGPLFASEVYDQLEHLQEHSRSTISTALIILKQKGFIAFKVVGRNNQYYPVIQKEEYSNAILKKIADTFFEGDCNQMINKLLAGL